MICIVYLLVLYGLYVPDWEYQIPFESSFNSPKTFLVKCGVRGDTGPACNAVGMIDRNILGIQHLFIVSRYRLFGSMLWIYLSTLYLPPPIENSRLDRSKSNISRDGTAALAPANSEYSVDRQVDAVFSDLSDALPVDHDSRNGEKILMAASSFESTKAVEGKAGSEANIQEVLVDADADYADWKLKVASNLCIEMARACCAISAETHIIDERQVDGASNTDWKRRLLKLGVWNHMTWRIWIQIASLRRKGIVGMADIEFALRCQA
ncbi:hypothetical protein PanWU01x14_322000 [Parasponia andersonii]|uniref:Uncharacterized protein n=1 Tax=Parasponia andersonii TaxID=3476 RepID=A0A2P5AL09_PARAD|nr:hypothetical protein PanWU01x14_322000 [Parasponia andersonii]